MSVLFNRLQRILNEPLPGLEAHRVMTPYRKVYTPEHPHDARLSAVLILINDVLKKPGILLIRRTTYAGTHSGQISFPGGRYEPHDDSLLTTALRETREETGILLEKKIIAGALSPLFIPPSQSLVHPFVAVSSLAAQAIVHDVREVAYTFMFPVASLLNEKNLVSRSVKLSDGRVLPDIPCFVHHNEVMWGATAAMLYELRMILQKII